MLKSPPAGLRRITFLGAVWLAGTLLATATVYEAVTVVAGQLTAQRTATLSQPSNSAPLSEPSVPPSPNPGASRSPGPPTVAPTPTAPATGNPTTATAGRTFALVGGTAEVSCRGALASLDWATPKAGFAVETSTSDGGAQVEVRFRSDTHESRLEAWCSGGQVQASVREESS